MARRPAERLTLFWLVMALLVLVGVVGQRGCDGVLAVEEWRPAIEVAARESGLNDAPLLAAVAYAESRGDPHAVSSVGAVGLCQLLPSTAAEIAERIGVEPDLEDPAVNLRLAGEYLVELRDRYGGDRDLALLAYRIGMGRLDADIAREGGVEPYKKAIRLVHPGPWDYRTQILRFRARFAERFR